MDKLLYTMHAIIKMINIVKQLVEHGADVNLEEFCGDVPLSEACDGGSGARGGYQ